MAIKYCGLEAFDVKRYKDIEEEIEGSKI